ncbi:alpha/beta fold hydrolase [Ekhidna sp.]|jgi:predicted alpha/beta hydrolase|uniref:alpha/beta hydrolase family protein n=1 Tax=Ekhidna sp. TaxID=2608089 RepID=UPI0032F07571
MQNDFMIECGDGKLIAATHFGREGKPTVIISAATGAQRSYYGRFAQSLVEQGFQVVTFDYRGIGDSTTKMNDPSASMTNWGELDLTAVINWVAKNGNNPQIFLVGHSVGGQIFPLARNKSLVRAAYFIASQTASRYYWTGPQKLSVMLLWNLILPTTTTLTGKLPNWAYGGKYDLPKGVAIEWATWGRHKNGVLQDDNNRLRAFKEVNIPLRFISIADDKLLAPKDAVEQLYHQYGSLNKEHHHWYPSDFGKRKIGHFGFFRKENSEMWDDVHLWLKRYV